MDDRNTVTINALADAFGGVRFATILADPPWPSKSRQAGTGTWLRDHTKPKYQTMSADAILDLPVADIVADDAVLVLWSTWMHLPLAIKGGGGMGVPVCHRDAVAEGDQGNRQADLWARGMVPALYRVDIDWSARAPIR